MVHVGHVERRRARNRLIERAHVAWRGLPLTLQFLIAMIASAINERTKRKLEYALEEVQVVKEAFRATTGKERIPFKRQPGSANDNGSNGSIACHSRLGGLLNYCHRAAA